MKIKFEIKCMTKLSLPIEFTVILDYLFFSPLNIHCHRSLISFEFHLCVLRLIPKTATKTKLNIIQNEKKMNSFFSPDDHSIAPSNTIEMEKYQFLMLKTEMYDLINRLCEHFDLSAEIEFMCMDSFELYLDNLFEQLYREYDQKLNFERNTVDIAIEQTLYIVEKECLLRLVSLISICAKYIDGYRWRATYRLLPDLLCKNGTPYTYKDICRTEYNVFKCLNFTVNHQSFIALANHA